ncbi:TMEM175 family protein [Bdellovibrio sp. HCB185ZH]|uniref:TMEM175 family protein n=1 Tax=Bdellovibrio sp. HCB185ZH TaxID=3394235 RepID=UPI0039A491C4
MKKGRLEAFSDGVLAIIITIMVLELKVPHGDHLEDLLPLWPVLFSYVLSFIYVGIYWNNHHHLIHSIEEVDGRSMWANLHLLFWLSLIPVTTAWMGENHFGAWPVFMYGLVLLASAIAYYLLVQALTSGPHKNEHLRQAIGKDFKGKISPVLYISGMGFAFVNVWLACAMYVIVAAIWVIPDTRIEKHRVK